MENTLFSHNPLSDNPLHQSQKMGHQQTTLEPPMPTRIPARFTIPRHDQESARRHLLGPSGYQPQKRVPSPTPGRDFQGLPTKAPREITHEVDPLHEDWK